MAGSRDRLPPAGAATRYASSADLPSPLISDGKAFRLEQSLERLLDAPVRLPPPNPFHGPPRIRIPKPGTTARSGRTAGAFQSHFPCPKCRPGRVTAIQAYYHFPHDRGLQELVDNIFTTGFSAHGDVCIERVDEVPRRLRSRFGLVRIRFEGASEQACSRALALH